MGENPVDPSFQEKIQEYFKRDGGLIKGTRWFFDVCHNNLSNLFHLTNYLNRGKRAQLPAAWFNLNFPPEFNEDLAREGGINEGIIMQQVFSKEVDGVEIEHINMNGTQVYLHEGKGTGLGKFVRDWYGSERCVIDTSISINQIREELTQLLREEFGSSSRQIQTKKLTTMIDGALQFVKCKTNIGGRESSADSEPAVAARRQVAGFKTKEVYDYMRMVRQIKKMVINRTAAEDKDTVEANFYEYCSFAKLASLNSQGIQEAVQKAEELLKDPEFSEFRVATVTTFLQSIWMKVAPEQKMIRERDRAEAGAEEERARARIREDQAEDWGELKGRAGAELEGLKNRLRTGASESTQPTDLAGGQATRAARSAVWEGRTPDLARLDDKRRRDDVSQGHDPRKDDEDYTPPPPRPGA